MKVERLYLQETGGSGENPICRIEDYRSFIFKTVSCLRFLDGVKKEFDVVKFKLAYYDSTGDASDRYIET